MPIEALGYVNFRAGPGSITTLREDDFFHNRAVSPSAVPTISVSAIACGSDIFGV